MAYQKARYAFLFPERQKALHDAAITLQDQETELRRLTAPAYQIESRITNPGYANYHNYAVGIRTMAKIFPVFFYAIALMICLTTMLRMIDDQRK